MRQLERTIGNLARKVALKVAAGPDEKVTITADDIKEYLGAPRFYPEGSPKELPAGVATGMAWTEMGGEVLFIEATLLARRQRTDADRPTRRCDEGVRAGRAKLSVVARGRTRH